MDSCRVRAQGTKSSIEDSDPILAEDWREAAKRRNIVTPEVHRTAKDRWSLIRLVSRIGISVKHRNLSDGSWSTDREAHVVRTVFF